MIFEGINFLTFFSDSIKIEYAKKNTDERKGSTMKHCLMIYAVAFSLLAGSCGYKLDTQRHPAQRGTFGEEVYKILKKDLDRRAPLKGTALAREKDVFVRSIDGLLPEDLLSSVQEFCVQMLPMYDQKKIQYTLRPLACSLGRDLAEDDDFLTAVWYVRRPEGYGNDSVIMPLLEKIGTMEITPALLVDMLEVILEHDGLDDDFNPSNEDGVFADLLGEASHWLKQRTNEQLLADSGWTNFREWLFEQDSRLDSGTGGSNPLWLVLVDQRGRAMVAKDPVTGDLPDPFVDLDHDGLADVDPVTGDYVDINNLPIDAPLPFSSEGQRPMVDQHLLYRYADLRYSPLAALIHQLQPMISSGLVWKLARALPALLGPMTQRSDGDGTFEGYDADLSPLQAATHALVSILNYPRLAQLLESILTIAELRQPQLARLLSEADAVGAVLDRYPDVALREHNRLLDDLIPHLLAMSRRAYLLRIMESFDDPRWSSLGPGLAEMIRYRSVSPDGWDYYDDYDTYEQYLTVSKAMDWTKSDIQYQYRSNLQRGIHLIHDTNEITHSTEIFSIHVPFEIQDMLGFYLDSFAGLAQVPGWAEPFLLEFSSTNPSTEEVNRFMVDNHTMLGNPVGREGQEARAQGQSNWEQYELRRYNAEALMALEFSGALEGMTPMVSTIVQLDRDETPSGTRVLADFLSAVHPHYSCNVPYASASCANIRPLEPMLLDILDNTEVMDALVDFMSSIQNLQTSSGYWVLAELDQFVNHILEPDSALRRFDGTDSVLAVDGQSKVQPISPFYLLMDAIRLMDDSVSEDPEAESALSEIKDVLWNQFLEVTQDQGQWRFSNNQAWILLLDMLDYLRIRAKEHQDSADLGQQLTDMDHSVRDMINDRLTPSLVRSLKLIEEHPRLPDYLDQLLLSVLDQDSAQSAAEAWRLVAWAIQHLQVDMVTVPIGRTLGKQLDPHAQGWRFDPGVGCTPIPQEYEPLVQMRWISRALELFRELLQIRVEDDSGQVRNVASELVANGLGPYPGSHLLPADDILHVIGSVHRQDPSSEQELTPGDMAHILEQVSEFLLDEQHGIEKLYEMIDFRDGEKSD